MLGTLVLSLPSADVRRKLVRAELGRYNIAFEFFGAVSDAALSAEDFDRHYDAAANAQRFKRPLSPGEVACYLGHLQMWKYIAASRTKAFLILEDDFEFVNDPVDFLNAVAEFDLSNVIVKLDGNAPRHARRAQQIGNTWLAQSSLLPPRTTGYIIGARAAAQMIEQRSRFFRPVDIDLKHHWEHAVPVLITEKALVRERSNTVSSLAIGRTDVKPPNELIRFWRNLRYQTSFRAGMLAADDRCQFQLQLSRDTTAIDLARQQ